MNVLVTGAVGLIGSELTARLVADGHRVYGLVHDVQPEVHNGWAPVRGDVTDYRRIVEIVVDREVQIVYHLAAKSIVGNCKNDPLGCFATNAIGTANVLEAARQSERVVGVMCMESDKAYGDGPIPYVETQALRPGSVYEASKSMVSHLVSCYRANYGLPVFGVRCANVYGPRDRHASRLVPGTIARLRRGERPRVTEGADKFLREFIHVSDAVSTIVRLMACGPWGESVNVGTGEALRIGDAIRVICEAMGKPFEFDVVPRHETFREIPEQMLDLTRLRALVGETRPLSFADGVRATLEGR